MKQLIEKYEKALGYSQEHLKLWRDKRSRVEVECYSDFLKDLRELEGKVKPDIYFGELNEQRIAKYTKEHQQWNIEIGTVRHIFCAGADWALSLTPSNDK